VLPQTVSVIGETDTDAAGLTVNVAEELALQFDELVTVTV
jgi:hypothetical protein